MTTPALAASAALGTGLPRDEGRSRGLALSPEGGATLSMPTESG
jgi:hypothetical protein